MFLFASVINSTLSLLFGFFIFLNKTNDKQHIIFFLLSMIISLHFILLPFSIYHEVPETSIILVKLVHVCSTFIATFSILFVIELLFSNTFKKNWHFLIFLSTAIVSYFTLFGRVIDGVNPVGILPNWTVPGRDFFIYLAHYAVFTSLSLGLLVRFKGQKQKNKTKQINLILIGGTISLLGGWTLFLPGWGIGIEPYGIFSISLFQLLIGYGILKYNLFDIQSSLTRLVSLIVTFLLMSVSFIIIVLVFQRSFNIIVFSVFSIVLFIVSFVLGYLSPMIQNILITTAQKTFIKGWYDYEDTSNEITKRLSTAQTLDSALIKVKEYLEEDVEFETLQLALGDGYFINKSVSGELVLVKKDGEILTHKENSEGDQVIRKWVAERSQSKRFVKIKNSKKQDIPDYLNKATMVIPVLINNIDVVAAIIVSKKLGGTNLSRSDLNLLTNIQNQLSTLFHFHNAATKATQVNNAKKLQTKLLPSKLNIPNIDTAFHITPSATVGGDFLSITALENNKQRLILADVVDHGLEAGIGTFILSSILETYGEVNKTATLPELSALINTVLASYDINKGINVSLTMLIMDINPKTGEIILCGHHDPMLIYRHHKTDVETQRINSFPARYGVFDIPEEKIRTQFITIHHGDILFLYTDGLTEAKRRTDPKREDMFGTEQIEELLKQYHSASAETIKEHLLVAFKEWTGEVYEDDVCFVIIKR